MAETSIDELLAELQGRPLKARQKFVEAQSLAYPGTQSAQKVKERQAVRRFLEKVRPEVEEAQRREAAAAFPGVGKRRAARWLNDKFPVADASEVEDPPPDEEQAVDPPTEDRSAARRKRAIAVKRLGDKVRELRAQNRKLRRAAQGVQDAEDHDQAEAEEAEISPIMRPGLKLRKRRRMDDDWLAASRESSTMHESDSELTPDARDAYPLRRCKNVHTPATVASAVQEDHHRYEEMHHKIKQFVMRGRAGHHSKSKFDTYSLLSGERHPLRGAQFVSMAVLEMALSPRVTPERRLRVCQGVEAAVVMEEAPGPEKDNYLATLKALNANPGGVGIAQKLLAASIALAVRSALFNFGYSREHAEYSRYFELLEKLVRDLASDYPLAAISPATVAVIARTQTSITKCPPPGPAPVQAQQAPRAPKRQQQQSAGARAQRAGAVAAPGDTLGFPSAQAQSGGRWEAYWADYMPTNGAPILTEALKRAAEAHFVRPPSFGRVKGYFRQLLMDEKTDGTRREAKSAAQGQSGERRQKSVEA